MFRPPALHDAGPFKGRNVNLYRPATISFGAVVSVDITDADQRLTAFEHSEIFRGNRKKKTREKKQFRGIYGPRKCCQGTQECSS